ncbi:MAG: 3-dehydro-L-gulonate 2-dehydrogenase [Hungatella sp.]|nr:3-dehydro-L-gulonate 2-dehydrogenase [Hungatella sp.]MDR2023678.1 3-dehydro-L-gulonate 2-dehydrogenase [Hungatella sp.]
MRVQYEDLLKKFQRILESRGFSADHAEGAATVFAKNSLDGVYSHGVNRFPRVVRYLDKGEINPAAIATCESSMGNIERWNGHRGFGPLNAKLAMDRACELAKEQGVGVVALGNNNHWMRGGSYGWQAADAGCIGICWSNTMPNMPAWGGKDRKIGNNPFIMAIPRSNGKHAVIDCAVSQFSYGKIEEARLKGQKLPVPGGYDTNGNITADPAEIEKTWRVLPMGYWKGSGISIALDLIATVLTNGNSVRKIGTFGDEVGLSQVMIAIDPGKFNSVEETDSIVDEILKDIKSSEPAAEGGEVFYPGELELKTREDNLKNGIPVIEEVWETLNSLER